MEVLEDSGVTHPGRPMNTLHRLIWDTATDPLWYERNVIMPKSKNKYNAMEDARLSGRITWYVEHHHELLDHHDKFLAEVDLTRLSGMQRQKKREWVRHLDTARKAWKIEREGREKRIRQ